MQDGRSPYYYLPGGRVKLGETAECAIMREISEELRTTAKIIRPLWLNQGFFQEDVSGENYHELCIYYLMDTESSGLLERGERFEVDENGERLVFEWLEFDLLRDMYFYPVFLCESIFALPDELTIIANYD